MASILKQLVVPKGKNTQTIRGSTQPELDSDPKPKPEVETDPDSFDTLPAQPQSPSPEAEYDKLLVSKTNKLPLRLKKMLYMLISSYVLKKEAFLCFQLNNILTF